MLRSVRLRNFRSLRDTETVELRPIVLLVGANSSGKSSLLRFFPLLKQTASANSSSPLLWFSDSGDVDFESFNNTLFRGAREPWIGVSGSCAHEEGETPGARHQFDFTSRIASGPDGRSYIRRFTLSALDDTLEFDFGTDGAVGTLRLNGRQLEQHTARSSLRAAGLIPRLDRAAFRERAWSLLTAKIWERVHGSTSDDKLSVIADHIRDGADWRVLRTMQSVRGGVKTWRDNIASLTPDSPYVREIKELLFLRSADEYLEDLEEAMARFTRGVRYLGPFRSPPQRFYRKAELAIGEIDRDGSNLAMFLDSLGADDSEAFSTWVRQHFGFGVRIERRDAHVALMIDSTTTSRFNLMDMGFGMSQLLPVIAQCWLSSGQLRSGQIPLFRDHSRSILPGTAPTLIAVEQPELHLHPQHQAQLADMFCHTANATSEIGQPLSLWIETHSEAMIYRFGELVEAGELRREDISILFFEKTAGRDESTVRSIEFDHDGVLQNWPIGFFRG